LTLVMMLERVSERSGSLRLYKTQRVLSSSLSIKLTSFSDKIDRGFDSPNLADARPFGNPGQGAGGAYGGGGAL
jgi:hypothetical protein